MEIDKNCYSARGLYKPRPDPKRSESGSSSSSPPPTERVDGLYIYIA